MDSALFFRGRMDLDRSAASAVCGRIIDNARRFGGTIVINWHDRSLAPERLWGGFYEGLLAEIGRDGRAWFARAGEAVEWFRWRRSLRFNTTTDPESVTIDRSPGPPGTPPALVQVHRSTATAAGQVAEIRFDGQAALALDV
jgi:hypothetical protein